VKKFLLTGACLAVLTGPAFAGVCPYKEQLNAMQAQQNAAEQTALNIVRAAQAKNPGALVCSPEWFAAKERSLALSNQVEALVAKARSNPNCSITGSSGGNIAGMISEYRAKCAAAAADVRKKEEARRQENTNPKEIPTPRRDNSKIVPTPDQRHGSTQPTPRPSTPPTPNYVPGPGTKTFDEGGVPSISPIPYESKPSPSTPTTPQVPGDRSSPDDPTANHLKEANEEFGRANQTVRRDTQHPHDHVPLRR
jgi:hypothetical protein